MEFERKRWLQLAAGLVISLCAGIGYTWSVFQSSLIDLFGWDIKITSLIFTLQVAVSTTTPLLVGRLQARIGARRYLALGGLVYGLCLLVSGFAANLWAFVAAFGVGVGLGTGMIYPCLMGYGVRIFPDKSGLAAGLLAGAYGAGAVLWAPTAAALGQAVGVMNVYKILGAAFAAAIVALSLFFSEPPDGFSPKASAARSASIRGEREAPRGPSPDLDWRQMIRTGRFYLLLALFSLGTASGLMIMGHASSILQGSLGVTAIRAASMVGLVSVFNALGRVAWGAASDRLGRFPVVVALFSIVGLAMLALWAGGGALFVAALFAVGFCYGGFASLIAPVTGDAFGAKHVAVNYGYLYLAYGVGGVFGPQVAATIKAATGGYEAAFLIVSLFSVVGVILSIVALGPRGSASRAEASAASGTD